MDFETRTIENMEVVRIRGRLDATNAPDLERELGPIIDKAAKALLINLKDLDYISSAGLRALLMAAKMMKKKGGTLSLCSLQTSVKEVFDIAGFTGLFPIFNTEEEAIKESPST